MNHCNALPRIENLDSSLLSNKLWSTVSKAVDKSSNSRTTQHRLSTARNKPLRMRTKAVSQL